MSVDYSAQYGVGYKVEIKEGTTYTINGKLCEDSYDIRQALRGTDYRLLEIGDMYSGEDLICVISFKDEVFNKSIYSTERLGDELYQYINRIGLTPVGEFALYGGMKIS